MEERNKHGRCAFAQFNTLSYVCVQMCALEPRVFLKHKFKDPSQVYFAPATRVRRGPGGRNGGDEVELVRGT